jgi:hypothetical protein
MARRYPNGMTRLGSRLLLEPVRTRVHTDERFKVCSRRASELGPFLATVHGFFEIDTETIGLATDCLADLVESLPWRLWLKGASTADTISGFRRKVVDSLESNISITRCAFLRCDEVSVEAIARVCTNILMEIPWNEDTLVHSAAELWSTLANYTLKQKHASKVQAATTAVLVTSMGGRVTPQGDLLPMCTPARCWLSQESSMTFLQAIFDSVDSQDEQSEQSLKLLTAMLRTRPETAFSLWTKFRDLLRANAAVEKSESKLRCLALLEAFMLGRRNFCDKTEDRQRTEMIVDLACFALEHTRDDTHIQCRSLSFSAYAALLARDWTILDREPDPLLDHFRAMLSHCREPNVKVRAAACKAVGEFCSHYVSEEALSVTDDKGRTESYFPILTPEICDSMLASLGDKNASVRSMVRCPIRLLPSVFERTLPQFGAN